MAADDGRFFHAYGLEAKRSPVEDASVLYCSAGEHPYHLVYHGVDRDNAFACLLSASVCAQMGAEMGLSGLCRNYTYFILLPDVLPEIYSQFGTGRALY